VLTKQLGVSADGFVQVDGSGLSRHNLVSPHSLVQVFEGMLNQTDSAVFTSLLPVGGESGTLTHRFVGTPGQGKVHAKTGTMTGVNALSGYVDNAHFDALVFSIVVNTCQLHASSVRSGMDDIVNLLVLLDPSC
jgi:serine-type D-Ala-D-Ala carboxypeptidase/endopeptidase (penicillin-binding protein 4)